jgi:hypothetical protein
LTFGLGIIFLQGGSRRIHLAGVNIMVSCGVKSQKVRIACSTPNPSKKKEKEKKESDTTADIITKNARHTLQDRTRSKN